MCSWACWSRPPFLGSRLGVGLLFQLSVRLLLLSRHDAYTSPQQLLLAALHTNRALPSPAGSGAAAAESSSDNVGAPTACCTQLAVPTANFTGTNAGPRRLLLEVNDAMIDVSNRTEDRRRSTVGPSDEGSFFFRHRQREAAEKDVLLCN